MTTTRILQYILKTGVFLFFSGLLPCQAQSSLSQQAKPSLALNLIFERYTSQNGLPDNRIRSLHQDQKGLLWIGTMNGLSRYDGYSFKNFFKKEDRKGLTNNWSQAIAEAPNQDLWFGTIDGLTHFDHKKQVFTHYYHKPEDPYSLPSNRISRLLFDEKGNLWIGTSKGLVVFNPKTRIFKRFSQQSLGTTIGCLTQSDKNAIWVATEAGIVRLNINDETTQFYPLSMPTDAYGNRFWTLLEKDKNLYIGTGNNGLICLFFQPQYPTIRQFYAPQSVSKHQRNTRQNRNF